MTFGNLKTVFSKPVGREHPPFPETHFVTSSEATEDPVSDAQ